MAETGVAAGDCPVGDTGTVVVVLLGTVVAGVW